MVGPSSTATAGIRGESKIFPVFVILSLNIIPAITDTNTKAIQEINYFKPFLEKEV